MFGKKKRIRAEIILKSGYVINVKCTDVTINRGADGEVVGYHLMNIKGDYPIYINVNEIASVVQIK